MNVPVNPFGNLDWVKQVSQGPPAQLEIGGWAIDPNTSAAIDVHVYVNGMGAAIFTANASRPDVGAAYPGYNGTDNGFTRVISVGYGSNTVCAYGINVGPGANALLGCKTINVNQ